MLTLHSTADAARGAYLLLSDVCTGSFGKTGPAPVSLGPPCLDHAGTCSNSYAQLPITISNSLKME